MTFTNQEFYDHLCATHAFVFNEIKLVNLVHSMTACEGESRESTHIKLGASYKVYFTQQLLLSGAVGSITAPINRSVVSDTIAKSIEKSTETFSLTDEGLAALCETEQRAEIQAILALSLIPSYFHFFLVRRFFQFLDHFLRKQLTDRYDTYVQRMDEMRIRDAGQRPRQHTLLLRVFELGWEAHATSATARTTRDHALRSIIP
jgi:hypothetical protein